MLEHGALLVFQTFNLIAHVHQTVWYVTVQKQICDISLCYFHCQDIHSVAKLNSVALLARRVLNGDKWVKLEIVHIIDCSRTITADSKQAITSVRQPLF